MRAIKRRPSRFSCGLMASPVELLTMPSNSRFFSSIICSSTASAPRAPVRRIPVGRWWGVAVLLVGGHTEITAGLVRPIVMGTMLGEVERDYLEFSRPPYAVDPLDEQLVYCVRGD